MRAVIQRVLNASVSGEDEIVGSIGCGLLVFLGIGQSDSQVDIDWLVKKITNLRIFNDDQGNMAHSVLDAQGDILLISQFTLYGSVKKGSRPSFSRAAPPDMAIPLYENFSATLKNTLGKKLACGIFGASMRINALNDGPITILLDSKQKDL